MKQFLVNYCGIILGAAYALVLRLIFRIPLDGYSPYDLFSITFVFIAPIIIGIVPMIFASNEKIRSGYYSIVAPVVSVLVFFIITLITRIEDLICIIIIAVPYMFGAMVGGLIFGRIIMNHRKNKGLMFSILLIPFVFYPVEKELETPSDVYTIKTSCIINSSPSQVWSNIIRVREITETEYSKGFYNYAGIPRPLYAELEKDTLGATRIGHFEGGLMFKEIITACKKNEAIAFTIRVLPTSIRETVFDEHVLRSNHFKFLNASYELKPENDFTTKLILTSSYKLDTKINGYASYWGNNLLTDFQLRLLEVIKRRCEQKNTIQ